MLSESWHHQINAYCLAASAAGVGVLALTQPAEARIIYTKTHKVIGLHGLDSRFLLDLNNDGTTDFVIVHRSVCTSTVFCSAALFVEGNGIEGAHRVFDQAYAIKSGAQIGSMLPFDGIVMYYRSWIKGTHGTCSGSWVNVKNRYLGLRFILHGKAHFGWARLNVPCSAKSRFVGVLTGYAYETVPNKPITAGRTHDKDDIAVQPDSLGALAAGSSVLSTRRHSQGASK